MKILNSIHYSRQSQDKPPFPLDLCIVYLDMWYSGEGMYSAGSRTRDYSEITATFSQDEYKNLIKFSRWLQDKYPITGRYLYRSINTTKDFYKTRVKLISVNPLSSWTSDEDKAKQFFESVGKFSQQDSEVGCIIKCQMPESRILFSTNTVRQFIDDYYDLHDYSDHVNSKAIKFYKELSTGFWKAQDEYVCRTKDFPLPVEIVASTVGSVPDRPNVIWHSGIKVFQAYDS